MGTFYSPTLTSTVYSVIWPSTRALIRQVLTQEIDVLMDRHEHAASKRQDGMHEGFFDAWQLFASSQLQVDWSAFPEHYPCAGSSEAIREVLGRARALDQHLVVFEGEYEGYEALAAPAGTPIHRLSRQDWKQQFAHWQDHGVPWRAGSAQCWISHPSAIDGSVWSEFDDFLSAAAQIQGLEVWVDLAYLGMVPGLEVDLRHPVIAGVAFSLSKVFGTYYRRIGGLLSRRPVPGLWGNRWFKNLDALYLGERLLATAGNAAAHASAIANWVQPAHARFTREHAPAWRKAGIEFLPASVPLLVASPDLDRQLPADHPLLAQWQAARRGTPQRVASRRLCITPLVEDSLRHAG